ncbi:uncharacterized protein [Periplaneta americana]|uniref:uncharacterized protein isoform X2 n=1 Tax=Periplaneta americana TaxID=6978 RepID=UPI0037E7A2D5
MSANKERNSFWMLAKKYSITQKPTKENTTFESLLESEKHDAQDILSIMENICALNEKRRKLELENTQSFHRNRSTAFSKMIGDGDKVIKKMDDDLEYLVNKNNAIFRLLQMASKKKDLLPISIRHQRTLLKALESIVEVCMMRKQLVECFHKLSTVEREKILQKMHSLKCQILFSLNTSNINLEDVCELEHSVDELVSKMTSFNASCFDDMDTSSL